MAGSLKSSWSHCRSVALLQRRSPCFMYFIYPDSGFLTAGPALHYGLCGLCQVNMFEHERYKFDMFHNVPIRDFSAKAHLKFSELFILKLEIGLSEKYIKKSIKNLSKNLSKNISKSLSKNLSKKSVKKPVQRILSKICQKICPKKL